MKVKKRRMVISKKNAVKVKVGGKFPFVVWRKSVSNNSILFQFCRCWVHKRCICIRVKLKEDIKFKSLTHGVGNSPH